MLPSSGYFRGIACPAHSRGACRRPYCHFRHDVKERIVSSSSSSSSTSSQVVTPSAAPEETNADEGKKQQPLEDTDMRRDFLELNRAALGLAPTASPVKQGQEPQQEQQPQQQEQQPQQQEQQQPEPHTSQPVMATETVPKSELLQQLMSEALKKVLAENPTLASTVDASAIRIGIDPITHESPEGSKTKKLYPRPPDTPSYNPTPIRELKKRKKSVDGESSLAYNPTTLSSLREAKGNGEEEDGAVMGEFSSSDSEEVEEKHDDFDLLEEVLAEHSMNNKVKVKKKRVKELGKLQYSLSNTDKKTVDNNVLIADAKKLTDKEVKRYEVSQPESVNKVITDGPYFLPPSPIFTSSSDGFEAFNSRASYQEEEEEKEKEEKESVPDKPAPQTEPTKTNSEATVDKNTTPKQSQEPSKPSSQPPSEKKAPKATGHTHLPKLLPTLDAPKLARPNVRNWIPLVRNSIPAPDVTKSNDHLDEILNMMDGDNTSNKRKSKESENQTSQKDSEIVRPRKKYKVDLNKEIESLTNPAVDQVKEAVTPEKDATNHQTESTNSVDGDEKQSTKEKDEGEETQPEPKEKEATKKTSTKDSEDKEKGSESEAASESENSDEDSHTEESEEDSKHRRARHKKKRKRSRSSSSDVDYSRHRRKKRKRSHKRHRKRSKRSRKRRDSTSSLSDQSKDSEEEKDEEEEEEEEEEDEVDKDDSEEEEEDDDDKKDEEKKDESKEGSNSDDKDSNDEVDHKKLKRHRRKLKHYRKSKHKKSRRKAKRKRRKSYSRSRSSSGSRDSSRSRSRSRSSSKHRKKKGRSRHRSRNVSDSEERDSDQDRSRSSSRSSSRNSSRVRKGGESKEKDSSSKHKEQSKSKDEKLEEGKKGGREERKSRDRSASKSRQHSTEDSTKNHSQEDVSIPMPVDPSKIKVEKNASNTTLIPDLSKVKVEKEEESASEKSNTHGNASVHKSSDKSHEDRSKVSEKIHERRRSSAEEKRRRRSSHERKDSTESTSDKGAQRRQSSESKTSDVEASQQRKKTEERRQSIDKPKATPQISSEPSEMSMFDLVLASTKKPKPKTLMEISLFDAAANASTSDGEELSNGKGVQVDPKKKKKDSTHKSSVDSSGKSSHNSEHKSSSRTHKSSRSEKAPDSHHKPEKSESKSSHSSSKSKSSSSHHSTSTSTPKKSSSTSSSRESTSKHHSTSSSSSSSKHTDTTTTTSKNKKVSDPSRSEKDTSRHSSTSSRKHSSSSSSNTKHQDTSNSRRRSSSSSSSKHKEDKSVVSALVKTGAGREAAKKRKVLAEDDSDDGVSADDHFSNQGDSPLPDLSVLDEIPQDDWEQMLSSETINAARETLDSDSDEVDHNDAGIMEECMKMFNEFQPGTNPLENQVLPKKIKAPTEESKEPTSALSKQRKARSSSTGNLILKKPSGSRHQRNNPMQKMVERYQKLKEELKLKEQQINHLQGASSAVSSSSTSRTSIAAASSSTHHGPASHSSSGKIKKRIAHVANVSSLLMAQGKIRNHTSSSARNKISPKVASASGVIPETTAHTVAKGGKRVAHLPKTGTLARPIIQPEHGSLVPQNIRQRYLNALIEECKKFCSEREAFNIAAAEERVCYQRTPSRMVYLNLVVNAVKRLRTQKQAGEGAQELLDQDPQLAEKMCIEEPSSSSSKPQSSPSPSSSPSSTRPHPINPNHVRLSHSTVLSSGGCRGSWSIEKSKKSASSLDAALKGETFYKHLLKYVLTEEQLGENGYPGPDPEEKGKAIVQKIDTRKKISPSALERYCDRCSVLYSVDKWGFPKSSAPCVFHWGRAYKKRKYGLFETSYSCCGGEQGSEGCSQATTHVSQNYNPKNLRGYVRTISKDMSSSNKELYALDCEMCYTTEGNELTRVTVIAWDGNVVYEQLVKPDNPILDYNTRFSGITESDMEEVTLTIRDVQAALLARFSDKTILIGHSLESDLHALKLIHNTVVDTSVVFPHKMGAPYKRALKNLAAEYLKRIIQDDVSGHDSAEDAIACLHLMQWKVKEDLKGFSK
ncbi:titin homolog isoform X2 [Eriocheir sinensis]|uniref:titin homolog isoform X2 n=1 Tax=Eriocheir sinensis TaxID=95602 RepID=UPI0021CA3E6A|nr:titin homolog isoform X2 [Eriocheir sinensis]